MLKTFRFVLLFLFFQQFSIAQNLVDNPGFENHETLDCLSCHIFNSEFSKKMPGWKNLNTHTTICDCEYEKKSTEGPYKYSEVCPFEKIKTQAGCAMIQMGYKPSCMDWDHATKGCASYVSTLLKEPLQLGKKYEVSYWLYIDEPKDPGYEKHIGFTLFPDKIRNPKGAMIAQNVFRIDTIIHHKWYQVKWNIQPTCPLQYLVIGTFRGIDGPPVHNINRPADNHYFIDEVMVQEIPDDANIDQKEVTFFCKPELIPGMTIKPEVKGMSVYFDSGQDVLLPDFISSLDDFATRAKLNPKATFIISGHTDNVGSDHTELSTRRIERTLSYLESKHNIPRLRFIALAKGISDPKASNQSETGRQANRRVDISQVDYDLDNVVYRNLLNYVFQKDIKKAYKALNVWLHFAPHKSKLLMLNDPRIDILKEGAPWAQIDKRIRESYQQFSAGAALSYSVDSLWAEDQKHRTLKYYVENLGTYIQQIDTSETKWDVDFALSKSNETKLDNQHLKALINLIGKDNWVKQSEVGERAATANFLIIQHSMDLDLLNNYLPKLKARCMEGEAEWSYYAMMYDRLQTIQDLPQRYGTQFKVVGDEKELFPLEDPRKMNEWRNEIGLPSIEL